MIPTKTPSLPWQVVATDIFHFRQKDYLLLVEYRSQYPEVSLLQSSSTSTVIERMKCCFARHGIPETLLSDNGPPYASAEFERFAKNYWFQHVTASPRYPQANGEAERMVKTVKALLTKADDPHLALLAYRAAPGQTGKSPAEL